MASINKRGKFWRAQVVPRGYPPQYRAFDLRADEQAWARTFETEMDRGVFVSRVDIAWKANPDRAKRLGHRLPVFPA